MFVAFLVWMGWRGRGCGFFRLEKRPPAGLDSMHGFVALVCWVVDVIVIGGA